MVRDIQKTNVNDSLFKTILKIRTRWSKSFFRYIFKIHRIVCL